MVEKLLQHYTYQPNRANAASRALFGGINVTSPAVLAILFQYGADVNSTYAHTRRSTILHKAVDRGDHEVVELLVQNGAKINQKSGVYYGTALMLVHFRVFITFLDRFETSSIVYNVIRRSILRYCPKK